MEISITEVIVTFIVISDSFFLLEILLSPWKVIEVSLNFIFPILYEPCSIIQLVHALMSNIYHSNCCTMLCSLKYFSFIYSLFKMLGITDFVLWLRDVLLNYMYVLLHFYRDGILSALALITAVLCVARIVKLHIVKHPGFHNYIVFYCAVLECALL